MLKLLVRGYGWVKGGQTEISYIGSSKSEAEEGEILPLDLGLPILKCFINPARIKTSLTGPPVLSSLPF